MPAYVPLFSYSTMDMRDSLFVDENEKKFLKPCTMKKKQFSGDFVRYFCRFSMCSEIVGCNRSKRN